MQVPTDNLERHPVFPEHVISNLKFLSILLLQVRHLIDLVKTFVTKYKQINSFFQS